MPERLFDPTFTLAVPFWALMILAPTWSGTRRIVGSPLIAVPPLAVYAVLVAGEVGTFWSAFTDPSLAGVQALLGSPLGAAAIWAHLIAFDLLVGRWAYLDSRERGVHPVLMAPVLFLTIILAPFGFLAYLVLRTLVRPARPAARHAPAGPPERVR